MVALGRRARSGEIDPVLVLEDDPLAGIEARRYGAAGVFVAVLSAHIPDLDRLGGRIDEVDQEGRPPVALPFALGGQGLAGRREIGKSGGPLLELEELLGSAENGASSFR